MEIEFAGWERAGRGRLLQFYATHDEIAEWILEMLPPTFAPYTLLREEWVHPRLIAHEVPLTAITDSFSDHAHSTH
jgi:phosphoribulokinase